MTNKLEFNHLSSSLPCIRDTIEAKIMANIYNNLNIVLDFQSLIFLADHVTWSDLKSTINCFYDARNKIMGYKLGNSMFQIRYADKLFSFSFYCEKDNTVSIHVWNYDGDLSIGNYYQKQPEIMRSTLEDIKADLNNFINNKIHCSGCNKLIDMKDVAGSYYAGRYCKDCWENKYKAIEAADNYD